jgi:hypothetical protein
MKSSLLAIGRQTLGYRIRLLMPLLLFISVIVTIGTAIADEVGAGQAVRKQGEALGVTIRQVTAIQVEPFQSPWRHIPVSKGIGHPVQQMQLFSRLIPPLRGAALQWR